MGIPYPRFQHVGNILNIMPINHCEFPLNIEEIISDAKT